MLRVSLRRRRRRRLGWGPRASGVGRRARHAGALPHAHTMNAADEGGPQGAAPPPGAVFGPRPGALYCTRAGGEERRAVHRVALPLNTTTRRNPTLQAARHLSGERRINTELKMRWSMMHPPRPPSQPPERMRLEVHLVVTILERRPTCRTPGRLARRLPCRRGGRSRDAAGSKRPSLQTARLSSQPGSWTPGSRAARPGALSGGGPHYSAAVSRSVTLSFFLYPSRGTSTHSCKRLSAPLEGCAVRARVRGRKRTSAARRALNAICRSRAAAAAVPEVRQG